MRVRPHVVAAIALALTCVPRAARACGAAYPGGPVMCDYPRGQAKPPVLRMNATWAYTDTALRFSGGRRTTLTRHAVLGGIEVPLAPRWSLSFGAGGVADATMIHGAAVVDGGPGWSGYVGTSYRAATTDDGTAFLQLTLGLSGTHMTTKTNGMLSDATPAPVDRAPYTALDLRAGAIAGITLAQTVTTYALVRAFGGPIFHRYDGEAVRGTDVHKYQVGGGFSVVLLRRHLDLFVEGVFLGERGGAAGLGTTFF